MSRFTEASLIAIIINVNVEPGLTADRLSWSKGMRYVATNILSPSQDGSDNGGEGSPAGGGAGIDPGGPEAMKSFDAS
jgi:hypothetical protein